MTDIVLKTPAGMPFTCAPEDVNKIKEIQARRHAFILEYCVRKGWPTILETLSMEQILEIRKQPGWQLSDEPDLKVTFLNDGVTAADLVLK
jgi:hypothetical protein